MQALSVLILAAGKGERMVSRKPKVLHEIMGKPMVGYVIETAKALNPASIVVVLGHGREAVKGYLKELNVRTALQRAQRGTAHAVLTARHVLQGSDVLVLYGDVPLITLQTVKGFLAFARSHDGITFMTTELDDPKGYGRVVLARDRIRAIIEDAEATAAEQRIRIINTGICFVPAHHLKLLEEIGNTNSKKEYYLTDICAVAGRRRISVKSFLHPISTEVLGVNTRRDLMEANRVMRGRILDSHLKNGVTLLDDNVFIDRAVTIGQDTLIYPNSYILGTTVIGRDVTVGPNVIIKDSRIGDGVTVEGFVVIEGGVVDSGATVGPFSRIRPATHLAPGVRIGNFVEVKNSTIGENTRAGHLAYIGDAELGKDVNIGAGTITCNYDGQRKHRTIIEDNVFVGSNTSLVAPVTVRKDSIIGAGSTITKDVPEGSLAVERSVQKHMKGHGRRKQCAE
jgi:bifunctional UDP-N-acetylglucosamine pyrophosphorylase / glucosamine-1-phosphate N-acetyltransferase